MNTPKHTPGPWKAVQHPREHKWAWTIEGADGVGQIIARIGLVNDAQAVAANAYLIAAAPAMYEALKGMVTMYDSLNKSNKHDGACPCYHCQARATLAQAEGRG